MKKRIYLILSLSMFFFMAISCEKGEQKIGFISNLDPYVKEITVGDTQTFDITFSGNNLSKNRDYTISYVLLHGRGTVSDESWNVLQNDSIYKVSSRFRILYTAHQKGNHKVKLFMRDSTGQENELLIDLTAKE